MNKDIIALLKDTSLDARIVIGNGNTMLFWDSDEWVVKSREYRKPLLTYYRGTDEVTAVTHILERSGVGDESNEQ